jgi:hypothetical protein
MFELGSFEGRSTGRLERKATAFVLSRRGTAFDPPAPVA